MDVIFTIADIDVAAGKFLSLVKSYTTIAFNGEMGAGKTTFIYALCNRLQVNDTVNSPTFSIINQYNTSKGDIVYHIDLYRLKDEQEAIVAGVEDRLYSGRLCFVEWPERAPGIFPENTLYVTINLVDANTRKLSFNL